MFAKVSSTFVVAPVYRFALSLSLHVSVKGVLETELSETPSTPPTPQNMFACLDYLQGGGGGT